MTQPQTENEIIDLSEEGEEDDAQQLEEDEDVENADHNGGNGEDQPPGEVRAEEEEVKPGLKIVIRVDERISVGIQRRDKYPVFHTMETDDIQVLGQEISELVKRADEEWERRPELNSYDTKKGRGKPGTSGPGSASSGAGSSAVRTTRTKSQPTTQSGPKLL